MDDPTFLKQEIADLSAEAERLRGERDRYRGQVDALRDKREETVSAELRLLVQGEFFSLLKWVGGFTLIAISVATAGGFFTFASMITSAVNTEVKEKVKEKDEDIKSLRTNMIQSVADFKIEAAKALADIQTNRGHFIEAVETVEREIAIRGFGVLKSGGDASIEPPVTPLPPGIVTISVVVHVVYRTPVENISEDQIRSQIAVLNEDYQQRNTDIAEVPEAFRPFIGNAGIQFALATTDPRGQQATGITRTRTNLSSFDSEDSVKSRTRGGSDPWDTERFLNIWVATLEGGILEYAQFPGGPSATDGVVIANVAFGTVGSVEPPFNRGRAATHSIGHYLNVHHIWGDIGISCDDGDFVADTPNQEGPNYNKPEFPKISCSNGPTGDMFMNFMDYVADDAMHMFTKGQVLRMRETLQGSRKRLVRP